MGNRKSVFLLGSTGLQEITAPTTSYPHTTSLPSWCLGVYKVIATYQRLPATGRRWRDHPTKLWNIDRRKTSLRNVPGWNFLDGRDLCWLDIIFPNFRFRARWASKKKWQSDATRSPSFLVCFSWEIAISWRLESMFPSISISKLNTWSKVRPYLGI